MAEMLLGNIKGKDGNGIKSAVLNADDTLTLTFDDGTSYTTPSIRGATGADGQPGADGKDGAKGDKGDDGYTPVKGVDYWTDADREAMVQQVITALGTPVFGTVDAENNIILTGELADGTYTLKYEDADGNVTEIGTLEQGGVSYTNQIPLSINTDGTLYNGGQGWKTGYRTNSSGNETESDYCECTGFIAAKENDTIYMQNVGFYNNDTGDTYYISLYDSDFAFLGCRTFYDVDNHSTTVVDDLGRLIEFKIDGEMFSSVTNLADVAYMRVSAREIDATSIITVNEPIA